MSLWSRLKSLAGGHGNLVTLASAATLRIPDDDNAFYVSGTTTVTSLLVGTSTYNRKITLYGAAGAVVKFTNTNTLTTAGQMYCHGADRVIREDDAIEFFVKNDGTSNMVHLVN